MKLSQIRDDILSLCNLGLDSQLIMPTLLQMLHKVLPSAFNIFQWADSNGELSNCIFEPPMSSHIMHLYLNYFYNRHEAIARPTFTEAIKQEHGITDWEQYYSDSNFMQSAYYKQIMQPLNIRYTLRAYVPVGEHNSGVLILCREKNDKPFSVKEKSFLASIIPTLSYSLTLKMMGSPTFLENKEQCGVLILNREGVVKHANQLGQHFLFLLAHEKINAHTVAHYPGNIQPILKQLATHQIDERPGSSKACAHTMRIQNRWGLFILQRHLLNQFNATDTSIIATVQLYLPWQVKFLQSIQSAALSAKQKEACLWLIEGLSQSNIASQMGVSSYSVNDYLKAAYRKLKVHSKEDLFRIFLATMN